MTGRPLAGKRIVNTRAVHQAAALDVLLREHGAEAISYPCIDILPPEDASELDEGLRGLVAGEYGWLVLTSENTVLSLARRMQTLGLPPAALNNARTAVVGPKTAQAALELLGLQADLIPEEHAAEALAEALKEQAASRVFLPKSSLAKTALEDELRSAGFEVTAVDAYRTVIGSGGADVPRLLAARRVDAVTFTSGSTVDYFMERLANEDGALTDLNAVCLACIGRVTAAALEKYSFTAAVVPEVYTLEGLITEMEQYYTTLESEAT